MRLLQWIFFAMWSTSKANVILNEEAESIFARSHSTKLLELPVSDQSNGDDVPKISLGEKVSFEELGPIIINKDGTTSRIANWGILTKAEQDSSWRIISARNKKRVENIKDNLSR